MSSSVEFVFENSLMLDNSDIDDLIHDDKVEDIILMLSIMEMEEQ
jgi:hypothetical protein